MEEIRETEIDENAQSVEMPETPHFVDDEATLLARPVVPLSEQAAQRELPYSVSGAGPHDGAGARFSPWLLVLVIAAAISVGAAGALALDYFRHHKSSEQEATTTTQPSNPSVAARETRPAEQEPLAEVKPAESQVVPTAVGQDKQAEQSPAESAPDAVDARHQPAEKPKVNAPAASETARARQKREDQSAVQDEDERPQARKVDEIVIPSERRERRERRRRERDVEFPEPVRRANQELNRIREIFEGKQP
ncbi:MAG TPA: hypothetical protein VGB17_13040 [Pyrinomonadaceae bacterium]|jgi:hypothetical protein